MVGVALPEGDLGPQRLRERLERHPALLVHQRERRVERLDRLRQQPAQQRRAAEDGERPRLLAGVAAAPRGGDRLAEQGDGGSVVRAIRQGLAADPEHAGALAVVGG